MHDQNYWNIKQEKNVPSKNGLKNSPRIFSPGLVGEFKLTADVLLFWSAIWSLPSD